MLLSRWGRGGAVTRSRCQKGLGRLSRPVPSVSGANVDEDGGSAVVYAGMPILLGQQALRG
jgi:hypothetical protein